MTAIRRSPITSGALAALGALALGACRSGAATIDTAEVAAATGTAVAAPLELGPGTSYEAAAIFRLPETSPEDHDALHNVYVLSPQIVSGSEPHGEEAFEILAAKGIRTILSVDGKVPDEQLAARHGMKYVHVPIQYKGITEDEIERIAKTFREQPGPFYVHCFHGKHRGPAAAAIGRLVLDGAPREEAIAEMRQWCGTSSAYEGLYATIATAPMPTAEETGRLDWDFPAAEPLDGVGGAMVEISRGFDHLKAASSNDWQPNPGHPDLNAPNEAVKLADLFDRMRELDEVLAQEDEYRAKLGDTRVRAGDLRDALLGLDAGEVAVEQADLAFRSLSSSCTACHEVYRN